MTLLTIVQNVCNEVGLTQPSSVINNTEKTARQMLALLNKAGKALAKNCVFEALTKEATFATVATESQGVLTTIASGFDRFIGGTMYDRSNTWKIFGPKSPGEWQQRKATQLTGGFQSVFRIRGGQIIFNPVPSAGLNVYFEYMSKYWVAVTGAPTTGSKESFTVDSDVSLIDETLLELDLKWRFLKAKGLDYTEEFRDWQIYLNTTLSYDGAADVIGGEDSMSIAPAIPDGNWNQ